MKWIDRRENFSLTEKSAPEQEGIFTDSTFLVVRHIHSCGKYSIIMSM